MLKIKLKCRLLFAPAITSEIDVEKMDQAKICLGDFS